MDLPDIIRRTEKCIFLLYKYIYNIHVDVFSFSRSSTLTLLTTIL
jgi:hypothetical protein